MEQGGGGDLNRVMQQAAAIKSEQVKQDRRNFEAQPEFVQHTLFFEDEESVAPRSMPYPQRYEAAKAIKDKGNDLFKGKEYAKAVDKYERALGCFHFFVSKDPNWKKNGIKDENLDLKLYIGDTPEQHKMSRDFQVSCLNNIGACFLNLKMYRNCIGLLTLVLRMDNTNAKALYRRAKAFTEWPQAGAAEANQAIKDLTAAYKLDPSEKLVRNLLAKLRKEQQDQAAKDKKNFDGMFKRGEVVDNKQVQKEKQERVMTVMEDFDKRVAYFENMKRAAAQAGKEKEATEIEETVKGMKAAHSRMLETKSPGDFRNPTAEMLQDARLFGLDLLDPRVVEELERIEREKTENGEGNEHNEDAEPLVDRTETPKHHYYALGVVVLVFVLVLLWSLLAHPVPKAPMGDGSDPLIVEPTVDDTKTEL